MKPWIEAINVPKTWEGRKVWQWNAWEKDREPFVSAVPPKFSRELKHCGGVWYRKFECPKPPPSAIME